MYFDLNVPVPTPALGRPPNANQGQSKKGKGKANNSNQNNAQQDQIPTSFSPGQITALESRIDLLVHLGYSVLALNQVVYKRVDPKTHTNFLDGLLAQLRKRDGVAFMKRLTIVLDEDSEKGFGLTTSNTHLFAPYDILALHPTTSSTFSLACLTHTTPSPLTTHIISLPLTLPRLPYHLKHTLVKTALKNGCVFEVCYAGALGEVPASDSAAEEASAGGASIKRNWWAGAREVVRVIKGKGNHMVISGGVASEANLRAPRDIGNLITLAGLAQDAAHDAATKTCKAIVLRAQTRRTYRAVLSEPVIVFPDNVKDDQKAQAGKADSKTAFLPSSNASAKDQKPKVDEAMDGTSSSKLTAVISHATTSQSDAATAVSSLSTTSSSSSSSIPPTGPSTAGSIVKSLSATSSTKSATTATTSTVSNTTSLASTSTPVPGKNGKKRPFEIEAVATIPKGASAAPSTTKPLVSSAGTAATGGGGGGESKNKKRKKAQKEQQQQQQ